MGQDAAQIKERIISLVKVNGPSLPVFIAREIGLSILFSSAFLSELFGDKELKMSYLRIGSSPLYFLSGQESMLENYSQYLKNKEREAYLVLKEKRFVKDKELEPAIRVALREIKDFAVPFKKDNEIFWRYFLINESEFYEQNVIESREEIIEEPIILKDKEEVILPEKGAEIVETEEKIIELPKKEKKRQRQKKKIDNKKTKNENNKFFNKIKEFLSKKKVEILDIEEINIDKIVFRVKEKEEYLIIAYNKKKITEEDIINSYKKSKEIGLKYKILLLGEPVKKISNLIDAIKELKNIEKVE